MHRGTSVRLLRSQTRCIPRYPPGKHIQRCVCQEISVAYLYSLSVTMSLGTHIYETIAPPPYNVTYTDVAVVNRQLSLSLLVLVPAGGWDAANKVRGGAEAPPFYLSRFLTRSGISVFSALTMSALCRMHCRYDAFGSPALFNRVMSWRSGVPHSA